MPGPAEEPIRIRIASPEDAPALSCLLEAFNGPGVCVEHVRRGVTAPDGLEVALLAEWEGQAVGFACLRVVPCLADIVPYAEVTELYVDAAYRRRGIGTALMDRAAELAGERGAHELLLLTGFTNQAAQAFYRALGFHDTALAMGRPVRRERERG
jgi:ribosomal protein S18 acetylase RimI-like enzyme